MTLLRNTSFLKETDIFKTGSGSSFDKRSFCHSRFFGNCAIVPNDFSFISSYKNILVISNTTFINLSSKSYEGSTLTSYISEVVL